MALADSPAADDPVLPGVDDYLAALPARFPSFPLDQWAQSRTAEPDTTGAETDQPALF